MFRDVSFTSNKETKVLRQRHSLAFVSMRDTEIKIKIKKRLNYKQMADDRRFLAD